MHAESYKYESTCGNSSSRVRIPKLQQQIIGVAHIWTIPLRFENASEMSFANEKKTSSSRELRNKFWSLIAFLLIQSFHSRKCLIRWKLIGLNQPEIHAEKMFLGFALVFTFFSLIDFIACCYCCCCLFAVCGLHFVWLCTNFQMQRPFEQQQQQKHLCLHSFNRWLAIFRHTHRKAVNKSGHSIHLERHIIF